MYMSFTMETMKTHLNKVQKPMTLYEVSEAAKKRVALISREFRDGFEFLKSYPRSVTIFGSARVPEGEEYFEKSRRVARRIAEELHYAVITGGGPGIMGAANQGAFEGGGNSLGLTIELPHEQKTNEYITGKIGFHYFFSRKVNLAFSAESYIFFPGGFGTLDEFSEILTLVQTNKIPKVPIILVGTDFWKPLEEYFKAEMLKKGFIDAEDLLLYTITDNEDEIIDIVKNAPIRTGIAFSDEAGKSALDNQKEIGDTPLSTLTPLAEKHCIPCEGGTEPLSHAESKEYMKGMSDWLLIDDKEIEKTYEFKNFTEAIDFLNKVADIAESENHHPDIKLHDYNKVSVHISTHAIGGLSENDFILASKIDETVRESL